MPSLNHNPTPLGNPESQQALAEKPDARGLAVPGMPLGSPGMEVPEGRQQPYTVELVHHDGTTEPFAQH